MTVLLLRLFQDPKGDNWMQTMHSIELVYMVRIAVGLFQQGICDVGVMAYIESLGSMHY